MVILSIPPFSCGEDLGCDLSLLPPLLLNLLRHFSGDLVLFVVVCEDAAAVLGAHIGTLTVFGRGVVHAVEEFEEFLV